ncbi:MAG: tRNA guanosine(34) transglycosylase Tgt [Calditrichaeota bacterium]|nr:tRNA guanosine(34) transglycosylase Tgt [Calditrichota bacterium]
MKPFFELIAEDPKTGARAGVLHTDHGDVETPVFMPVGTQGTVKTQSPQELLENKAQIILGNTYHLYLRPGGDLIRKAGGLHPFISWPKAILTDSGGYQVFSLSDLRKLSSEGVRFQSHVDGSKHLFTPESVVDIQRQLGPDIMMALDECTPYPCTVEYAKKSHELTVEWAKRSKEQFEKTQALYGYRQFQFGINQGSTYRELRQENLEELLALDFDGYAIGGLAVGEPKSELYEITEFVAAQIPKNKPRYLMGVGKPEDLVEVIARGVDMFDCVMPTRNARNGTVFTREGRLVIKNATYKDDFRPIDETCSCATCRNFSRAYIRHLFSVGEVLALRLATYHNIHFYLDLVHRARKAILRGQFKEFREEFYSNYHVIEVNQHQKPIKRRK